MYTYRLCKRFFAERTQFYSVIWRIANDDHRFLMATGSMPLIDYSPDKDLPIDNFSLIEIMNDCLSH
jgi:hypothetical protein